MFPWLLVFLASIPWKKITQVSKSVFCVCVKMCLGVDILRSRKFRARKFPFEFKPSQLTSEAVESPRWGETVITDSNGEVVNHKIYRVRQKNRGGFVICYTARMAEFIENHSAGSVVRVFLYIAQKQTYGNDGVFGFRTTRSYLAKTLGLTRKTVYSALEYLKSNFYINELRIDGSLEFMVNPDFITIGNDRKSRDREWNARWEFYWKKLKVEGEGK